MTRFSRVIATPLLSAAIFGATIGMADTASARTVSTDRMHEIQDLRAHQTMYLS